MAGAASCVISGAACPYPGVVVDDAGELRLGGLADSSICGG